MGIQCRLLAQVETSQEASGSRTVTDETITYTMQTLSQELLETCRQLNGLLKTKDPYHSEIVERMLNKIENEQNKDSDRDLILKALTGVL